MIIFLIILGWCFVVSVLSTYLLKKRLKWQAVAFNTVAKYRSSLYYSRTD